MGCGQLDVVSLMALAERCCALQQMVRAVQALLACWVEGEHWVDVHMLSIQLPARWSCHCADVQPLAPKMHKASC